MATPMEIKQYKKDAQKRLRVLRQRAQKGEMDAQIKLARRYENGDGLVEKNLKLAILWYRRAAAQNDMAALCKLADWYANGKGVAQSLASAFKLYQQALSTVKDKDQQAMLTGRINGLPASTVSAKGKSVRMIFCDNSILALTPGQAKGALNLSVIKPRKKAKRPEKKDKPWDAMTLAGFGIPVPGIRWGGFD